MFRIEGIREPETALLEVTGLVPTSPRHRLEGTEPWGRRSPDGDLAVFDEQLLKERLVEHAAGHVARARVGRSGVIEEMQRFLQSHRDVASVAFGASRPLLDLRAFVADARLLGGEDVFVDELAVGELNKSLLLLLETFEPLRGAFCLVLGALELALRVRLDGTTDALLLVVIQPRVALVVALDGRLDDLSAKVRCGAAVAEVVPSEALEVLVATAVAGDRREEQPSAALPAVDGALEVVLVLARSIAAQGVRATYLLRAGEHVGLNEPRVLAVGLRAHEGDHADVVVVAEHPVHSAP